MRIIVVYDKHSTRYIDATSDDQWERASLTLLRDRLDAGYYYSDDPDFEAAARAALGADPPRWFRFNRYPEAWGLLLQRSSAEYENVELRDVEETPG